MNTLPQMNIAIVGHVDHGKSTIIGRLLADTGSLPEGKLEQVRETCRRNAKPFEYAFLLDALKDEQAQGITIDVARVFFRTARRHYLIIDAPGHVEFLKNMVSGASRAEVALLVIDAVEGVRENSLRHGYLLSLLGISRIVVLVNKMDLVGYAQDRFQAVRDEFSAFLARLGVEPLAYLPVAGMPGDNIASRSQPMPWYQGPCLLELMDSLPQQALPTELPFRLPVQDIYKFTAAGDDRRIVAGTVLSGRVGVGDEVVFYPSGKKSAVKSIEAFNQAQQAAATAGCATGFTLQEQIYLTRGEIATLASQPRPEVTTRLQANLFWLGKEPLCLKREYLLKLGTARIPVRLESISRRIDTSSLAELPAQDQIGRHEAAECVLKLQKPLAFETVANHPLLSRFVLVDRYEIRGGGIITQALADQQSQVREQVLLRNFKWERSLIPAPRRAEKYNQKATLLLVTGPREAGKKTIAKALEAQLFAEGKVVYYLGIGNVLYGVDADIKGQPRESRQEHIRRLAEVANILLDAGLILIVTAVELTQEDLELIKTAVNPETIETIWVGDAVTTDLATDLTVQRDQEPVARIKDLLQERGIIFRPW